MSGLIADQPAIDVAHLHNVYHQLSPSILAPLHRAGIPVVMTVHDYKLVCPVYTLVSHGEMCERCVGGHFQNAVRRRCNRGSLAGSALVAGETWLHRTLRLWEHGVDVFVTPSSVPAREADRRRLPGRPRRSTSRTSSIPTASGPLQNPAATSSTWDG